MLGLQDGEEKKGEGLRWELVAVGWRTGIRTGDLPRKEAGVGGRGGGGRELLLHSEGPSEAEATRLPSPLYTHVLFPST